MQPNSKVDTGPVYLARRKTPKYYKMGPARGGMVCASQGTCLGRLFARPHGMIPIRINVHRWSRLNGCAHVGRTKSTFTRCFRNPRSFLSLPRRSALHRDAQRRFNGDEGNDAECWCHREPARQRVRPPEGGGAAAKRLLGGAQRQWRDVQRRWQVSSVNYSYDALLPMHEVRGPEDGVSGYYIRGKLSPYSC
jgi:hypothetical protein